MSRLPQASIVISSYNYGQFLRACIDSALNQTYSATEVVVVDDASTDDSPDIIRSYGTRVVPVLRERNEGSRETYNVACRVSRGDVVMILDSDDLLCSTAIERAMEVFRDPDVVKVHWPLWKINAHGHRIGGMFPGQPPSEGDLRDELARLGPFAFSSPPTSGNAYSRRFLESVLPVPTESYGDAYVSMWALASGKIGRIREPQGFYRWHGQNSFQSIGFEIKLGHDLRHARFCIEQLREHFQRQGTDVDTRAWEDRTWYYRAHRAMQEVVRVVPEGSRFVLVDGDTWGARGSMAGRTPLPFLERDGRNDGEPVDSRHALVELERMRAHGAGFVVFPWSHFWWLTHYADMAAQLRAACPCVIDNEHVVVFDLRGGVPAL
jgi:glycosyltransferase involved in cell wall biosynthesis